MKKKIIVFILVICIVFISIIAYKKINNSNTNNEEIIYDYTQYPDNEVFYQTIGLMFDEEKSKYEFKNEDMAIEILSQQQIKENSAIQVKQFTFVMLKDKLYGRQLKISRYETIRDDEKNLTKYILRIPNAQILNYEIEKLGDTENKVEILDFNKNKKTQFKDGEGFYLRYSPNDEIDGITYKFTITFKIDKETYKITKEFIIR